MTDQASQTAVVVGIATTGRAPILDETLRHIAALTDAPDGIVVSIAAPDDIDRSGLSALDRPVDVISSERGLCAQRNAILDQVGSDDILLFLDDDFMIAEGFITATRKVFDENPDVVMATGHVLADGILGPGMDHAAGRPFLAAESDTHVTPVRTETYNGYGCNMAVRVAVAQDHGLRFDTTLPRYGWLEDVDFSRRIAAHGRIVKDSALRGVHLGTKTGRSRGVPLGYSQIANPVYLMRKGTMAPRRALRLMTRNILANLAKSLRPEPWVDRGGRLKGNGLALVDLVRGRLAPGRIEDL